MSISKTVVLALNQLLFLCLLTAASSFSLIIRHDVRDSEYLDFATEVRFAGVGQMQSKLGLRGTGTYIGNGWILTAAHVADDTNDWTFRLGGVDYPVAEFHIHPEWTGDLNDSHDVAVMRLSTPTIGVDALPIALLSADVGDAVQQAGYGFTGTGAIGVTGNGGQLLRAGTNNIELDLNPFGLEYVVTFFDSPGSGVETSLETQGAFNDSGGPLIRATENGWEIVGTTSFIQESFDGSGDGILGNYGDLTGFADTPTYRDWIDGFVRLDVLIGDVNQDDIINLLDVAPFIDTLVMGHFQAEADINFDGVVDLMDVEPFVQLLEGS